MPGPVGWHGPAKIFFGDRSFSSSSGLWKRRNSSVLDVVSRLGLEPRALALKGQIERLLHKMTESDGVH